jgi:hypothetical protein
MPLDVGSFAGSWHYFTVHIQASVAQSDLDQVDLPLDLQTDDQQMILRSTVVGQEADDANLHDVIRNWSRANQTRITNMVMNQHPACQALPEAEQVQVVREAAIAKAIVWSEMA